MVFISSDFKGRGFPLSQDLATWQRLAYCAEQVHGRVVYQKWVGAGRTRPAARILLEWAENAQWRRFNQCKSDAARKKKIPTNVSKSDNVK